MSKHVFFSFHFKDVAEFRANVVRQHWVTKQDRKISGYYDKSIWESAKTEGDIALKRLINSGLDGTSNTCVLIGTQTFERPWVRYELLKSYKTGKHLFGVHINGISAKDGTTKIKGPNPFEYVGVQFSDTGLTATLKEWNGSGWIDYTKIDGTASYRVEVAAKHFGKFYKLSSLYRVYDWIQDDGFNNFATWVG